MPPLIKFIKEKYVLPQKEINGKFSDFYEKFNNFCNFNKYKVLPKPSTSRELRKYNFELKNGTGNNLYIKMDKEKLYNFYKNKNWLH